MATTDLQERSAESAQASFRDPGGSVVSLAGRILRIIQPDAEASVLDFIRSSLARDLVDQQRLAGVRVLDSAAAAPFLRPPFHRCRTVLEHDPVPFVSFPYEWPPEMLHAAAELTLSLARRSLPAGYGLKDATPYNVLFRGPNPVFVDLLSFEQRHPGDPIWLPYAQFVRTFVLPLALARHCGLRLDQTLMGRRDGLELNEVYRLLRPWHRFTPPLLSLVSIPTWLSSTVRNETADLYSSRRLPDAGKSEFILQSMFSALERSLRRFQPAAGRQSAWSGYRHGGSSYSGSEFAAKTAFVEQALRRHRPKRVLDVGCNTGYFSLIAARAGASVVAVDQDPVVVGEAWRAAVASESDILPLVVDLCRPTPATGWRNAECPSFLDRARGSFDGVLMLAVLHHMLVTERIPMEDIVKMAAGLTSDLLVIEFIGPEDPLFRRLLRGRDRLHRDVSLNRFQSICQHYFDIIRVERLGGSHRWIHQLRKR